MCWAVRSVDAKKNRMYVRHAREGITYIGADKKSDLVGARRRSAATKSMRAAASDRCAVVALPARRSWSAARATHARSCAVRAC